MGEALDKLLNGFFIFHTICRSCVAGRPETPLSDSVETPLRGLLWPHFVPSPSFCSKRENASCPESPVASWTEAALKRAGPGRTRWPEPRWGEASVPSRFERFWWHSTAGASGPPSFRPLSLLKAGNRSLSDSPAASWTKAALTWSGPGRTRRPEPRWGEASGYCRAIRLPVGRRREESQGQKPPRTPRTPDAPTVQTARPIIAMNALRISDLCC